MSVESSTDKVRWEREVYREGSRPVQCGWHGYWVTFSSSFFRSQLRLASRLGHSHINMTVSKCIRVSIRISLRSGLQEACPQLLLKKRGPVKEGAFRVATLVWFRPLDMWAKTEELKAVLSCYITDLRQKRNAITIAVKKMTSLWLCWW